MKSGRISFVVWFVCLFGLMIAPWPGFRTAYGDYFRALGNLVFERHTQSIVIYIEPHLRSRGHASMDSQIVLYNPHGIDKDGDVHADFLGIDSRAVGWIPTCLIMALILATPLTWPRRIRAVLLGLLLVQTYILGVLAIYIINQSTIVGLLELPAWAGAITNGLEYTFVTQMGPGFAIPILIWLLVWFMEERSLKVLPH